MIRLITRGDDAGSSVTANRAIQDCCVNGILRNVSVMACCDAVEDAADRLSGLDSVCFGFHATLNAEWTRVRWGSVAPSSKVASVVQDDGTFCQSVGDLESNEPTVEDAVTEMQAQLDRGREVGLDFVYADQHMGFGRAIPGFDEAFDRWCASEGILNFKRYHRRLPWVQKEGDAVEQLLRSLASVDSGQWAVVGHPGYETEELQQIGNDRIDGADEARNRDGQRRWFMDPEVITYFETNQIQTIRYDEAEEM